MADVLLKMSILEGVFGICRLEPGEDIPVWALSGSFFSLTKTDEDLSIVCPQSQIPYTVKCERDWRALKVEGPLDFSLTGILASISALLAQSKISIFAISTFDTDYVLVKENDLDAAVEALRKGAVRVDRDGEICA